MVQEGDEIVGAFQIQENKQHMPQLAVGFIEKAIEGAI